MGRSVPRIISSCINIWTSQKPQKPTSVTALCLHHSLGIFMLEQHFGPVIQISTGRTVPVRFIGEQHVIEDLGRIPTLADWTRCIRPEPWMGRTQPVHLEVDPFAHAPASEGS